MFIFFQYWRTFWFSTKSILSVYSVRYYGKNIDQKIKKRINYIGLFLISFLIIAVLLVTISRYNSSESDTGNIFTWLALYAGEGPLNFNNDMWYVTKSTNGDNTFVALRWLLGLTDVDSVQDNWLINQNLGVRGNVFYTYIGFIFADYNIVGTILFLSLISILLLMKIKPIETNYPFIIFSILHYGVVSYFLEQHFILI